MKSSLTSLLARVKGVRKRTWVILALIGCSIYFTYQEPESREETTVPRDGVHLVGSGPFKRVITYDMLEQEDHRDGSVSMRNGKYSVDTTIIYKNGNKKELLAELSNEQLDEKRTVEDIPYVIRHFLDSIAANGKFDIADPTEQCQDQPIEPGKEIPSRKLVHFSIGQHIALLSFSNTGLDKAQHVAIIRFQNDKVLDLWFDNITCPIPAKTKAEIIKNIQDKCS